MRITVQAFKDVGESETEVSINGVVFKSPDHIETHLRQVLGAAQLMWPEAAAIKDVFIVNLKK